MSRERSSNEKLVRSKATKLIGLGIDACGLTEALSGSSASRTHLM